MSGGLAGAGGSVVPVAAFVVALIAFARERWGTLVLALLAGGVLLAALEDPAGTIGETALR